MVIVIKNQTANQLSYVGTTVLVSANGNSSVAPSSQWSLAQDSQFLADVQLGFVTINDGVSDYSFYSALEYVSRILTATQVDSDNATIMRVKQCPTGWTYQMRSFEMKTATLASLFNQDYLGNSLYDISIKFYDVSGTLITDPALQNTSVKMVADFEPTSDYYLIGGQLKVLSQPVADMRVSVVAVPDLTYAQGGSRVMVQNVNMRYVTPGDRVNADGRAAKFLQYNASYHTNKLRFNVVHSAGEQISFGVFLESYKL